MMTSEILLRLHLLFVVVSTPVTSLTVRLASRGADGAAMCALDPPTVNVTMATRTGFPPPVVCVMACTSDAQCKHLNYISATNITCQLYHYRPTSLNVVPGCRHYQLPGELGDISTGLLFKNFIGGVYQEVG